MDVVYQQGEQPWELTSKIIAILKKRYEYSAGSMGIEMDGGNINLIQLRLWMPQKSIFKDPSPTLSKFNDFLVAYENYRVEGERLRTIISCVQNVYKMWPTAMQDQAFQGLLFALKDLSTTKL